MQLTANGMPAANLNPAYKLTVTYRAPQAFRGGEPAASPSVAGEWAPKFDLKNIAIHAHLLPMGKVLYWGRRAEVGSSDFATLNDHHCETLPVGSGDGTERADKEFADSSGRRGR